MSTNFQKLTTTPKIMSNIYGQSVLYCNICQAIVQHCRTSDLELTATCCLNCDSLSLSTFKSRLKTHRISTAFC